MKRRLTFVLGCFGAVLPIGSAHARHSTIPVMVRILPGQFVAGSPSAETDAVHYPQESAGREQPQRRVTVARAFAIGRTEVTRGQFAAFVAATGWKGMGACSVLADASGNAWHADPNANWHNPGFAQTDRHPVVCVDLADAENYARWLSTRTGRRFRLPSNTEWEYAARAGTTTSVWWAPSASPCRYANVSDAARARVHNRGIADPTKFFRCNDGHVGTAPVGSFRRNPWGLYDVIGNVWEWTADCVNSTQMDAPGDTRPRRDGDCASHINRGSSWVNSPKYVRAAAQHPDLVGARTSVLGFRLVEDLQ